MLLLSDPRFSSDPLKQEKAGMVKHLPRGCVAHRQHCVFKDDPDHARLRRLVNKALHRAWCKEMVGTLSGWSISRRCSSTNAKWLIW